MTATVERLVHLTRNPAGGSTLRIDGHPIGTVRQAQFDDFLVGIDGAWVGRLRGDWGTFSASTRAALVDTLVAEYDRAFGGTR